MVDYSQLHAVIAIKAEQSGWIIMQGIAFDDISDLEMWRDVITSVLIGTEHYIAMDHIQDEHIFQALSEQSLFDEGNTNNLTSNIVALYYECDERTTYFLMGLTLLMLTTNMIQNAQLYTQKIVHVNIGDTTNQESEAI